MKIALALLSTLILLPGCRQTTTPTQTVPEKPSLSQPTLSEPSPEQGECAALAGGNEGTYVNLKDVRIAAHANFDRITFEFQQSGSTPGAVPKYQIETISRRFTKDPSDQPMEVDGTFHHRVIFHGASGVELSGESYKEIYTGPDELSADLTSIVEAEMQGDFEATLSWIIGTSKRSCPSAVELNDPFRVAIDFPH